MGFTPMSADDYRALDHEALVERRNAVVALLEAEKLPEGVTTEMLAAECDIIRKDEARRELVRSMRSAQKAEVSKAPVIATSGEAKVEDPLSTMEYRTAFMNYVIDGKQSPILQKRGDATGTSADLGVLIPQTVIQMIIEGVQGVYGQLYSRVRKFNIKGGVSVPIGSFTASFHRIAETAVSDRQDAGGITGSITFSYKIGEIRLARTLLQTVLSVPVFERRFAEVVVETYLKAMDHEIMLGAAASGEMEGILTEADKVSGSRIDASHIIDFNANEMADWKSWQTKLFAEIPLSMRRERPEFVMTANTYEANIKTLADDENRPVYYETYNPVDGDMTARFKGREVVFVEEDILENFDDAADGEYFGMYWVPEMAYAINTNLEFSVVDYFDHETNQYVKKAIVINDGKILDPKYIWLLRKDGGSTPSA